MKKVALILSFSLIFLAKIVFAQSSAEQQLNSLLSSFNSMSANFEQTAIVKNSKAKSSTGTMALQRPGKFRWEINSPSKQLILADGKYLWVYDVDLEQATKKSLTKDAHSPANLLSGSTADIEQRFIILDSKTEGDTTQFVLKPKSEQDMVQRIELKFIDKKLSQMAVVDKLGQKNIFHFTNVKINPTLSNSLFKFSAPKGVDIIKN